MSTGSFQTGKVDTSSTTGSVVNITARDCVVIGFWANATTTIVIYDDSGVSTAGGVVVNITACAIGWNPLPISMSKGLAVNQGAQVWFSVI
jgi:hypothetical protein